MDKSIGEVFAAKQNNFDLIRLMAALLVIVSHSYYLTGFATREPFVGRLLHRSGGTLAVCAFFAISGFLVVRSLERGSITSYVVARVLRIFPALVVVVLVQTLLIGAVFSTLPLSRYFTDSRTYEGLRNILLFDLSFTLPGVFENTPWPGVNGSLWTLPIEVMFYLMLPWLGIASLLKKRWAWLPLVTLLVLRFQQLSQPEPLRPLLRSVAADSALDFAIVFWAGAMLWVYRDLVPMSAGLACTAIALLFAASGAAMEPWIFYVAFPYLVIYAALVRPVGGAITRHGDLSYGVYLYAFPIQQALVVALGPMSPTRLTLYAIPITVVLAWFSWRFVEAPALRLKRNVQGQLSTRVAT